MASPNTTSSATTDANSSPPPLAHRIAPDATTGNRPGSRLTTPTNTDRKAMASRTAANATQIGSASLSCWIMRALLRAAIAGRPVTEMV